MDIEAFQGLLTPDGQAILAEAAASDLSENALISTAARLRKNHPPHLVAAALTQVRLRERARAKFGDAASRMYFTPAGLEQSTRAPVATHRAHRFTREVLELGCGIGGDLIARGLAGVPGVGVELDPLTAAVARANVEAFGLGGLISVREGDATRVDPRGFGAMFADPGRRSGRGRVFDPRAYQPPLDVVLELAGRVAGACVKVAPGIPYEAIPDGAEAEWVSVGGEVKEAALWLGDLAGDVRRRATLISDKETVTLTPGVGEAEVRDWGRYLYEPDGAVIRAHLVAEVAEMVGGGLADPQIAYVTGDELVRTPFASAYEIEDVMPFSLKRLRAELRRRDVGVLTLKKRGSAVDLDRLRRDLGFKGKGGPELVVVLTRVDTAPVALLTRPMR
jgi:SAM-dependent methyltransferase